MLSKQREQSYMVERAKSAFFLDGVTFLKVTKLIHNPSIQACRAV